MGLLSTGAGTRNTAWDYSFQPGTALAVGVGKVIDCQDVFANAFMQIAETGSPSTSSVNLECSLDGTNWTVLGTSTSTSSTPALVYGTSGVPFRLLRANVTATTGGTSPTVTAFVGALPGASAVSGGGTIGPSVAANQGSPNTIGNSWPVEITNGTVAAGVDTSAGGGNVGSALLVSTGNVTAGTSLTAASAVSNGTTIDFGSSVSFITAVFVPSVGSLGGASNLALEVSQDGTNWLQVGSPLSASGLLVPPAATLALNAISAASIAFRYARACIITNAVTGGTVTATISAS
jgi:hypothetical protein